MTQVIIYSKYRLQLVQTGLHCVVCEGSQCRKNNISASCLLSGNHSGTAETDLFLLCLYKHNSWCCCSTLYYYNTWLGSRFLHRTVQMEVLKESTPTGQTSPIDSFLDITFLFSWFKCSIKNRIVPPVLFRPKYSDCLHKYSYKYWLLSTTGSLLRLLSLFIWSSFYRLILHFVLQENKKWKNDTLWIHRGFSARTFLGRCGCFIHFVFCAADEEV